MGQLGWHLIASFLVFNKYSTLEILNISNCNIILIKFSKSDYKLDRLV